METSSVPVKGCKIHGDVTRTGEGESPKTVHALIV
jgi:hypothetical protein